LKGIYNMNERWALGGPKMNKTIGCEVNAVGAYPTPPHLSPIMDSMQELATRVDNLFDTLSTLETQLVPILSRSDVKEDTLGKPAIQPQSELHEMLLAIIDRLECLNTQHIILRGRITV